MGTADARISRGVKLQIGDSTGYCSISFGLYPSEPWYVSFYSIESVFCLAHLLVSVKFLALCVVVTFILFVLRLSFSHI